VPDAETALQHGADGVGLLRTEFLYLERDVAPSEEEQFEAYSAILAVMGQRPVVARTLDIGGDKPLPYLRLDPEANPFLGWRAIRFLLEEPELFKPQLRALLRASPGHDLRIMFPMVATLEDIRRIKALVGEVRQELTEKGDPVSDKLQTGIMVEIPSVAVLADHFAGEVDFFSIGTNDLTQYTLAADRTNAKVAHYSDSLHPAVLRLISQVIETGHSAGIWVGVCGELAGEPAAVPILLGLGLDEFSMAPGSIPRAKAIIRQWSLPQARKLAAAALSLDTASAIRELVGGWGPG
jgi:phosphoenolpyruvate-protein phosphotransferase